MLRFKTHSLSLVLLHTSQTAFAMPSVTTDMFQMRVAHQFICQLSCSPELHLIPNCLYSLRIYGSVAFPLVLQHNFWKPKLTMSHPEKCAPNGPCVKSQLLVCGAVFGLFGTLVSSSLFASHKVSTSTKCFFCDGILPQQRGDSNVDKWPGTRSSETVSQNKVSFFVSSWFQLFLNNDRKLTHIAFAFNMSGDCAWMKSKIFACLSRLITTLPFPLAPVGLHSELLVHQVSPRHATLLLSCLPFSSPPQGTTDSTLQVLLDFWLLFGQI